ncbi:18810_t:CDS:2, partial [Racocetra fulgida]
MIIDDDVIYYDELKMSSAQLHQRRKKDEYYLPPIEGGIESMIKEDDPRMATKEDLRNYIKKYKVIVNNLNDLSFVYVEKYTLIKNGDGLAGYTMVTNSAIKSNNLTGKGSGTIDEPVNLDESSDEKSIPDSENEWEEVDYVYNTTGHDVLQNGMELVNIVYLISSSFIENESDDLLLNSNAYVYDDEPIESVMKRFNVLESEQPNLQNFKLSNREIGSVDSLSDDQDTSKSYEPDSLDSLYAFWLSQMPPIFQSEYPDHDERIRKAIYELDDSGLEEQKALAIKRLGKLKEGDNEKEAGSSSSGNNNKAASLYLDSVSSTKLSRVVINENPGLNKLNGKRLMHEILNPTEHLKDTIKRKKLVQMNFESFNLPVAYDTSLTINFRRLSNKISKKLKSTPRQIIIREIKPIIPNGDLLATDLTNDVKHTSTESKSSIQGSSHCIVDDGKIKSNYFEYEMHNDIDSIRASEILNNDEHLNKTDQNHLLLKTDDLIQTDLLYIDDVTMSISGEVGMETNDLTLHNLNLETDDLRHTQCNEDCSEIDIKDSTPDNNISLIHQHNGSKINVIDLTSEPDAQTDGSDKSDNDISSSDEDVFESREEHDNSDEDIPEQLTKETSEFARFLSELQNKDLGSIQKELTNEIQQLNEQQRRDKREVDTKLLKLFGIPYVIAPMEAEAQCAELLRLKLVDGIITEDSDVFLFGGTEVYKNMFNQQKYVERYLAQDFEQILKLNREKLIRLAILLGSDYTAGLPGIGIVSAMELLNEFPSDDGLEQFKSWWLNVQSGKYVPDKDESDFKKKFVRHIWNAYMNPQVDDSKVQFEWGFPDLDDLR